jgi:imidazolonepropionase-like amidohydrolase
MHHEQELLVAAGLSNLDSILAATCLPAKYFGLNDRGVIEPGRRANLLLTGGNPLEDIGATRLIKKGWCSGIGYKNVISA